MPDKFIMKITKSKAFALATTLVLLGVVLIGASTVLSVSRIESKISRSQKEGIQAYYVAEAGIQYAIKKINSDSTLSDALQANTLDTSLTLTDKLAILRDLTVNLKSISPGRAEITSTGKVREDVYAAQRVVKVEIFQGLASTESLLGNNSLFGNDGISVQSSSINITNSDLYVGGDQDYVDSTVNAPDSTLSSTGEYLSEDSTITAETVMADNYPPEPEPIDQPGLDFSDLLDQADAVYTTNQFRNLIKAGGTVDFPGPITYINGGVMNFVPSDLNNGVTSVNIIIHGLIISNSNFNITTSATVGGQLKTINLTVVDDTGGASGLVSRSHISLSGSGTIDIDGVVYAGNTFTLANSSGASFDGGIIAKSLNFNSATNVTINGDPDRVGELIGVVTTPSMIQIDHWEEEY